MRRFVHRPSRGVKLSKLSPNGREVIYKTLGKGDTFSSYTFICFLRPFKGAIRLTDNGKRLAMLSLLGAQRNSSASNKSSSKTSGLGDKAK